MTVVFLVLVSVCVFGGFMLEGGPILEIVKVWQEYIIIFGGGTSIFLAMCPSKILNGVLGAISGPLKESPYNTQAFNELLQMMYECFVNLKRNGKLALEKDVSDPAASAIFSKYPSFVDNHHGVHFFCDTLKMVINYNSNADQVETMLNAEIDSHHAESAIAPGAINRIADAMPAVGICAAVLGVIIAMAHIDGPPAELGHKVSAALTGTLLGILAAYGYYQPIAQHMEYLNGDESQYYEAMKLALVTYLQGAEPLAAVEIARRSVFHWNRPDGAALEEELMNIKPRMN